MQPQSSHFQPHPWSRSSSVYHGVKDIYGVDVAPSIFENQVIPYLATIRVLSLGTNFIPQWNQQNRKRTFADFNDIRRELNNQVFFVEEKPGICVQCKEFRVKNYFFK